MPPNSTPHSWSVICFITYGECVKNWPESYKQKDYSVIEICLEGNSILICVSFYFHVSKQACDMQCSFIFVVASHGRKKVFLLPLFWHNCKVTFTIHCRGSIVRIVCVMLCTVSFSGIDETGGCLGHHQLEGHQGQRNILKLNSAAQSTFNSPSVLSAARLTMVEE